MVTGGIQPKDRRSRASAEIAFERLSDDETVRGSLEDDAFGPLLDFIGRLALAASGRFGSTDALYSALRGLLAAAVRSVERGEVTDLDHAVEPFIVDRHAPPLSAALGRLGSDPADNARAIVQALGQVTGISSDD